MDALIDTIRSSVAADATDEARAAGAQACRTILAALETPVGAPLAISPPATTLPPAAQMLATLRGVPAEQLLDLAIAHLRAKLPADAAAPMVEPLKFHIIQLPKGP